MDKAKKQLEVVRAYHAPTREERARRALPWLRGALHRIRREGWVQCQLGLGLTTRGEPIFDVDAVPAADVAGWTLTGAIRSQRLEDILGRYYAEHFRRAVLPCEVQAWNDFRWTDAHDAHRALMKAIRAAVAETGLASVPEHSARGAADASATPRRVRSADR